MIFPRNVWSGNVSTLAVTAWPTATWLSACCGTEKSTNSGSSACSVTTVVPGLRYCPRSTARIPRCPANGARKRLLRQIRLLLFGLRARVLQVEVVRVDHRLADRLGVELPQVAVVVDLRQRGACLQRGQLRGVVIGAQPQQHLPRLHIVARLEVDLVDHAADLQRQRGTVHRAQAADRLARPAARSASSPSRWKSSAADWPSRPGTDGSSSP